MNCSYALCTRAVKRVANPTRTLRNFHIKQIKETIFLCSSASIFYLIQLSAYHEGSFKYGKEKNIWPYQ